MKHIASFAIGLTAVILLTHGPDALAQSGVEKVPVRPVWDLSRATERSVTRMELSDLIRFKGRWYCSFREAQSHGNHPSGTGRIIRSADGEKWESVALLKWEGADVREPKLSITAEGVLMAYTSIYYVSKQPRADGHYYQLDTYVGKPRDESEANVLRQSVTWLSTDGTTWSGAYACPSGVNTWRWSVTWSDGMGYSIGHPGLGGKDINGTLYRTRDGKSWRPLLQEIYPPDSQGNEAALAFDADGTARCLLRAGGSKDMIGAMLGTGKAPYYQEWQWKTPRVDWMGDGTLRPAKEVFRVSLGGPKLMRLSDGRLLAAGRMLGPGQEDGRIALFWVDPDAATLTRFAEVDGTSYAGVVEHEGMLWVSCVKTDASTILLAKMKVPTAANRGQGEKPRQ
jgi:hypothetical protein